MLDLAAKYETELQVKFANAFMDSHFIYYFGNGYINKYKADEGTWNKHEFVSVKDGNILGYLAYSVNRRTNSAYDMGAINFTETKNTVFSKDFMQFLKDIFEKYRFRKLNFGVYLGNPAEEMYDKYIKKFGGRIVGIEKEADMLLDGNFYDFKTYEIFRTDYLKAVAK